MSQYSFGMKHIGDYGDDFESTLKTGDNEYNKVQAVKDTDDDGIFVTGDADPDKIRLRIYAPNGSYKASQPITLSTTLAPYDYFEPECPDETAWDVDNINSFQCGCTNLAEAKVESYKSQRVPAPIYPIISAGVRVWARFDNVDEVPFIDKVEKIINVE